ncbi:MAG: NepR family anti-sigma factor [Pseudomonadota bacterium]
MNDTKRPTKTDTRGAAKRQKRIGDQLRQLYDEVASEPVPDDFLKLLEEADDDADEPGEDKPI